jgi:hypothetical protein
MLVFYVLLPTLDSTIGDHKNYLFLPLIQTAPLTQIAKPTPTYWLLLTVEIAGAACLFFKRWRSVFGAAKAEARQPAGIVL